MLFASVKSLCSSALYRCLLWCAIHYDAIVAVIIVNIFSIEWCFLVSKCRLHIFIAWYEILMILHVRMCILTVFIIRLFRIITMLDIVNPFLCNFKVVRWGQPFLFTATMYSWGQFYCQCIIQGRLMEEGRSQNVHNECVQCYEGDCGFKVLLLAENLNKHKAQ